LLDATIVRLRRRSSLHNTDGLFDRLSKQYVWRNKLGRVQTRAAASLAYSDFTTIETLRINNDHRRR
jgi:hypothetical protein